MQVSSKFIPVCQRIPKALDDAWIGDRDRRRKREFPKRTLYQGSLDAMERRKPPDYKCLALLPIRADEFNNVFIAYTRVDSSRSISAIPAKANNANFDKSPRLRL
jgi:hypothetical protein